MRYSLTVLCLCGLVGLAACGRDRSPTMVPASSTPAPGTAAPATPTVVTAPLVDTELLRAPGVQTACDHPPAATLTCRNIAAHSVLTVDVPASSFARWRLHWTTPVIHTVTDTVTETVAATDAQLTGTETLYLRLRSQGALQPNLYFVEREGRRFLVSLAAYGLREGWNDLYVPLAEVADEAGDRPSFGDLTAIQIVFEWADMRGELEIERVQFVSVWREDVTVADASRARAAALTVPPGFAVQPIADDLGSMTQLEFVTADSMLVSLQQGRVWWYRDENRDGVMDRRHLYTTGLAEVVGLLHDPVDGSVWLGGRGQIYRTVDSDGDGVADQNELRVDGLPWGRHQNNGMAWNPDPDPFTGEGGGAWIYFGLGSTGDLEAGGPLNAAVLRFPRDGRSADDLEVVSRGNRNPYDVVWAPVPTLNRAGEAGDAASARATWQLFASENGPDFNDAPDEVNHIRWRHHYGFPQHFGVADAAAPATIDGLPYAGALYDVTPHASASGLAYVTNPSWPVAYRTLYVSLFGQVFSPDEVGHTVERIALTPLDNESGITYRGEPSDFIVGLDRPLPMTTDPAGNLIVGDYATGVVYRVIYVGEVGIRK